MISVQIPNVQHYELHHAVFDYNGTLAEDGRMTNEVRRLLAELAAKIHVAVITADSFGLARQELQEANCDTQEIV